MNQAESAQDKRTANEDESFKLGIFQTVSKFQTVLLSNSSFTAILYWTYRAELTNDPSFRVNQKGMTVKPHASVRKRWNTTVRFATSYGRAVRQVNSDFDIFIRILLL